MRRARLHCVMAMPRTAVLPGPREGRLVCGWARENEVKRSDLSQRTAVGLRPAFTVEPIRAREFVHFMNSFNKHALRGDVRPGIALGAGEPAVDMSKSIPRGDCVPVCGGRGGNGRWIMTSKLYMLAGDTSYEQKPVKRVGGRSDGWQCRGLFDTGCSG